jgi:hypothetical protein
MSVYRPVTCTIEVTINIVYATLFMYYSLLEDVLFLFDMFRFSRTIFRQYTYDFTKIIIAIADPFFFGGGSN